MTETYGKCWLSFDDQIALLESRGLIIDCPEAKARDFLQHVNYYRLSGYCLSFESARNIFYPGTTLSDIRAVYAFDRILRDLLADAIEVIEIDLRTIIAYSFTRNHGSFGHCVTTNFTKKISSIPIG